MNGGSEMIFVNRSAGTSTSQRGQWYRFSPSSVSIAVKVCNLSCNLDPSFWSAAMGEVAFLLSGSVRAPGKTTSVCFRIHTAGTE